MPKHIHSEHYLSRPHELFPQGTVHPEIEHIPDGADHYMIPVVFKLEKGERVVLQYPGPGVYFISEGDIEYEDTKNPGEIHKLSAGAVVHIEKDAKLRWYSPNVAKGFSAFWVPVSVQGLESFVASE